MLSRILRDNHIRVKPPTIGRPVVIQRGGWPCGPAWRAEARRYTFSMHSRDQSPRVRYPFYDHD